MLCNRGDKLYIRLIFLKLDTKRNLKDLKKVLFKTFVAIKYLLIIILLGRSVYQSFPWVFTVRNSSSTVHIFKKLLFLCIKRLNKDYTTFLIYLSKGYCDSKIKT